MSNVTDIDDKIIDRAREEGRSEEEVAAECEAEWFAAMDAIGVPAPDETPHATHYLDQMVALVGEFLERGVAYTTSDGVYFAVSTCPTTGCWPASPSIAARRGARRGQRGEALAAGLRPVEERQARRAALAGALRRGAAGLAHRVCRDVPRAARRGLRPAHGGPDLRFPHHENERAQAEAWGRPFRATGTTTGW